MNEQKILKQFSDNLKMEFAIKEISVYRNSEKIFGKTLDNALIESYLSLSCSTVYKNSTSSVFVTRFGIDKDNYIVAIFSDNTATFDGQEAEYIISSIKKIKGKLGEKK